MQDFGIITSHLGNTTVAVPKFRGHDLLRMLMSHPPIIEPEARSKWQWIIS